MSATTVTKRYQPPTELKRPDPTPEQAALGIVPAAIGNGTTADIDNFIRNSPRLPEGEFDEFLRDIMEVKAESRAAAAAADLAE